MYIHETIEITVRHRQDFLTHFLSWAEPARELYGMRLFGVWAVNGSTHRWPEAIVMWEVDGLSGFTGMLKGEYAFLADPSLASRDHYDIFWAHAPQGVTDTKGADRLLAPTAFSPALADAATGAMAGAGYVHYTFRGPPGCIDDLLGTIGTDWCPAFGRFGLKLCGAYKTLLVNDSEAIALWAISDWAQWAELELAMSHDDALRALRHRAAVARVDWEAKLLNPAPGMPLLGRG
ncbi:hypothetical protein [Sphingomonas crocodyli]|uniref:NIPSNAP family containing protein n=1 Tax=Sphingomonas crocodyli TaxID=1979270 RepID=A0A437M5U2_9SPHN|nr:hypothetical protein [Sphingomonas crocodyli]RVT93042.1 hypothetical protein EOD43_03850 [Sphingomonas crocodyli]